MLKFGRSLLTSVRLSIPTPRIVVHLSTMRPCCRNILSTISHRRNRRNTRRSFQDETFFWAEHNKADARASLLIPSPKSTIRRLSTLEEYLEERGWITTGDKGHGVALISHVLSAPLTMRYLAEHNLAHPLKDDLEICCVGARAEATLPAQYWKEAVMTATRRTWSMAFVGPDVSSNHDPIRLQHDESQITLQVHSREFFHNMPRELSKQWDYYLLFNPGLGHPNLKMNWLPTLRKLRGHSLWLTAHSAADAERDALLLHDEMGIKVDYRPNPFASRIVYQDPFDKSHFVSPNKYIAWIAKDSYAGA